MALPTILSYIGILALVVISSRIWNTLYTYLKPSHLHRCLRKDKETWAVVTGASDGIGYALVHELLSKGFNVVLHGRNCKKLNGIQLDLTTQYPHRQTRLLVADASSTEMPYSSLEELKDLNITVLINNVGGSQPITDPPFIPLEGLTANEVEGLISLNVRFAVHLTRTLLPTLQRNAPSALLNIGSTAAIGLPWISIYAGCKGFLISLTNSLARELWSDGHDVMVHYIITSRVTTNQNQTPGGLTTPTARKFAKSVLGRIGCGRVVLAPYFPHALELGPLDYLPEWVKTRIMVNAVKEDVRLRAERDKKA